MSSVTGHVFLVISHITFVAAIVRAYTYRRYIRALAIACSLLASVIYHFCEGNGSLCLFDYPITAKLDLYFSFNLVPLTFLYPIMFHNRSLELHAMWIFYALSLGGLLRWGEDGYAVVEAVLAGVAFFLLLVYWVYCASVLKRLPHYSVWPTIAGITLSLGAFVGFYSQQLSNYDVIHALWHLAAVRVFSLSLALNLLRAHARH